jgi:hypothetical protein
MTNDGNINCGENLAIGEFLEKLMHAIDGFPVEEYKIISPSLSCERDAGDSASMLTTNNPFLLGR